MKRLPAQARLTYLPEAEYIRGATGWLAQRVKRYFRALDSLDADAAAGFFATEAIVRLAGATPIVGRAAIRKALVQFSLEVDELHHESVQLWTAGSLSVFEADMTVTIAGRNALTFPITHIIRWADGLIEQVSVSVYLESRLALALSAFDRALIGYAEGSSHKSMGLRTPSGGRKGSSILRPWPAEA